MKKEKHIVRYSFYQKKVQDFKGAFVHDIRICGGDVWTSSLEFPSFSLSMESGAKKHVKVSLYETTHGTAGIIKSQSFDHGVDVKRQKKKKLTATDVALLVPTETGK